MGLLKYRGKRLLVPLTGNRPAQYLLQRLGNVSNYLMGIGSGDNLFFSGEEAAIKQMMAAGPGPYTVFDVGANTGQWLKLLGRNLDLSSLNLHCFEPGGAAFAKLSERFGHIQGAILNQTALGDQAGHRLLYIDKSDLELASFSKRESSPHGEGFEDSEMVSVNTLDGYCREKGLDRIDLLKIDTEGHELDVLRGARRMLAERRVKLILFEFGGAGMDSRVFFRDIFDLLVAHGYQVLRITPSRYLIPIAEYSALLEQFLTTMYLAAAPETPLSGS